MTNAVCNIVPKIQFPFVKWPRAGDSEETFCGLRVVLPPACYTCLTSNADAKGD